MYFYLIISPDCNACVSFCLFFVIFFT